MNRSMISPFRAYLVLRESSVVGNGSPTNKRVSYLHPAGFSSQAGMKKRRGDAERETGRRGDTQTRGKMGGSLRCPSLAVSPRRRVVHCLLTRLKWISAR